MAPRIMATKTPTYGAPNMNMHSAGIYADMTVDGPVIGTLVIIVDRAKNLPNLRTVGKQDPYCAARLGKEAKKTDTDRRGGQTPRWDEELRFTVHDSPDYHTLKVSVFNDDSKTGLIGECWVGLEEILTPGGGKADAWHHLNVKGRYAGEIRIELTYYDSRPKPEKPRKQSSASLPSQGPQAKPPGPRQPIARRPLPTGPGTPSALSSLPTAPNDRSISMPVPVIAPRSYHTPPRQTASSESYDNESFPTQQAEYRDAFQDHSESYTRPLPDPHDRMPDDPEEYDPYGRPISLHHGQNYQSHSMDSQDHYGELETALYDNERYKQHDARALQSTENEDDTNHYGQSQPSHLPHQRVQKLLGAVTNGRPAPSISMPHTHSAPQLEPQQMVMEQEPYDSHEWEGHGPDQSDEPHVAPNGYYHHQDHSYHHGVGHYQAASNGDSRSPAYDTLPTLPALPPPPTHLNSAPILTRSLPRPTPVQHSTPPSRALHVSTTPDDFSQQSLPSRSPMSAVQNQSPLGRMPPQLSRTGHHLPRRQLSSDDYVSPHQYSRSASFAPHLSQHADPMVRSRDEMSYDPRHGYGSPVDCPDSYLDQASPLNPQRGRPISYGGPSHSSPQLTSQHQQNPQEPLPLFKPHAISPSTRPSTSAFTTPRKSVSPRPTPERISSMNAYSPDSFGALNPSHSNQSTPSHLNLREPTPMYTPAGASLRPELPQSTSSDVLINPDGTVTVSDGRTKDASDHLPASSYAPEPERKGADKDRPSTRINIQSRFGPRESGSTPPTTSAPSPISTSARGSIMPSSETRERLYRRAGGGSNGSIGGSSPLTPSHPNILNFNPRTHQNQNQNHHNQNSAYPPPVPAKVPLSPIKSNGAPPFRPSQAWMEDYEGGGEMKSLAADLTMVHLKGDDEGAGASAGGKVKTNGAGRLRKAKWSG